MSYLRALVRKTRAPRPQIAPRAAAPPAEPGLDFALEVDEEVVAARRAAPTAPAAPTSPRERAIAHPADAATSEHARAAAHPAPHDDALAAARRRAPEARAGEATAPPGAPAAQLVVSRRTHMIRRRAADRAPPPAFTERGIDSAPAADLDGDPIVPVRTAERRAREPAPRHARPSPAAAPPPHDRDQSRPDVHISIGRLEVRATAATPVKPERPAPFRPSLTLRDYLAGRSRGQ
jgi:hypothetical protein